jgi:hypothetical protein
MKTIQKKYQLDKDTIVITWNVEDVKFQAGTRDLKLSVKECRQVLKACLNNHDAALGLSWCVIDEHIRYLFNDRIKEAA